MSDETLDIDHLRGWIGRTQEAQDIITPRLVESLHATLDSARLFPARSDALPVMTHWCLTPMIAPQSGLGPDGHPARGGFLPPVPFPRRMWASSEVEFLAPLQAGDTVTRLSRVADVALKGGKSGSLVFVTVDHLYATTRGEAIRDRQIIVYRPEETAPAPTAAPADPAPVIEGEARLGLRADPPMLVRYCALIFNSHRIHFDRPYAMNEEHYPGLVVHGPLQASLLAEFSAHLHAGQAPKRFSFRGLAPLFDGVEFALCAEQNGDATGLRILDAAGRMTMQAKASW